MSDDQVTIVIVNYETSAHVRPCVESLRRQSQPHEIVVVDNASEAEDWRNLTADSMRLIRSPENLGYGRACNLGAQAASEQSKFICILNPDTQVPEAMLARWVEAHRQHLPGGGILGPRLLNENGVAQRSAYRLPGFWSYWPNHSMFAGLLKGWKKRRPAAASAGGVTVPQQVGWIMGAAMLVDRATWNALGGFSDSYFLYAEDMDLCYRCHKLLRPVIYAPAICVIHTQGDPPPEKRHIALVRLFTGIKIFIEHHYSAGKRFRVKLAVILDMLLRLAVLGWAIILHPRKVLLKNRLRGVIEVIKLFCT